MIKSASQYQRRKESVVKENIWEQDVLSYTSMR